MHRKEFLSVIMHLVHCWIPGAWQRVGRQWRVVQSVNAVLTAHSLWGSILMSRKCWLGTTHNCSHNLNQGVHTLGDSEFTKCLQNPISFELLNSEIAVPISPMKQRSPERCQMTPQFSKGQKPNSSPFLRNQIQYNHHVHPMSIFEHTY